MQIQEVISSKDLERFVSFPWSIYRDDPYWVPPLKLEQYELLNPRKHPFYRHGTATKFLLTDHRTVLGRILVADDPRFNAENNSSTGTFGFFECVDDPQAARMLLDAAETWSKARGRNRLTGPMEYSTNYSCGLLIDGFQTPPRMMMPHNPPYYQRLLTDNSYRKNKDLFAWWFRDPHKIVEQWTPLLDRLGERFGITVRPFSRKNFEEDVKRCLNVFDTVRSDWWWSCVSLTSAEVNYFAKQLKFVGDENLIYIAEADGHPIGFSITVPDINEAIKPLNGVLTLWGLPIGLFRLWRNIKTIRTARMMVLCVLPEYRRKGVAERMILQTLDYGKNKRHFTGAELSWTDESNDRINRIIERIGAEKYKTYRVFDKEISDNDHPI